MKDPREIEILHITHIRNLPSIIANGGLYCDNERIKRAINNLTIAHQNIKDRRARRIVPVAAGGTVADYVPFYFAPRSPMLYAIHHGKVANYQDGQEKIIYLVSDIGKACHCGNAWCFTDGHAEMNMSAFYDDLGQIDQINWGVIKGKYWHDTPAQPDRKRQRQAEFLVHNSFPWNQVAAIGVMNQAMADNVAAVIPDGEYQPRIVVKSAWYC